MINEPPVPIVVSDLVEDVQNLSKRALHDKSAFFPCVIQAENVLADDAFWPDLPDHAANGAMLIHQYAKERMLLR